MQVRGCGRARVQVRCLRALQRRLKRRGLPGSSETRLLALSGCSSKPRRLDSVHFGIFLVGIRPSRLFEVRKKPRSAVCDQIHALRGREAPFETKKTETWSENGELGFGGAGCRFWRCSRFQWRTGCCNVGAFGEGRDWRSLCNGSSPASARADAPRPMRTSLPSGDRATVPSPRGCTPPWAGSADTPCGRRGRHVPYP